MNKKKIRLIIGGIISLLIAWIIIDTFTTVPIYLYIDQVHEQQSQIIIHIPYGSGHYYYKKYKLNQIEDGVYQIQGYGSMLSGKKYPLQITIDNSQNQIKEIKQKNLDNQLETIYSQ